MCDKNSNLNKAILAQVQSFATNTQKFSIHDITVALRNNANSGSLNLPEFETPNSQFKYNIPHSSVKSAFSELLNDGIFTEIGLQLNRSHNGVYFEYDAIPTSPAAPASIAIPADSSTQTAVNPITVQSAPNGVRIPKQSIVSKIQTYLDNHGGQTVTIEQIRAAIKCNGWTCSEIQIFVSALAPASLTINNEYPSKGLVNL